MTCWYVLWFAGRSEEPYTAVALVEVDSELVKGAEAGVETTAPPALDTTVVGAEAGAEPAAPPALVTTKDPTVK